MKRWTWILAAGLGWMTACGSGSGSTGVDAAATDSGDAQIAPEDAATDATTQDASDAASGTDSASGTDTSTGTDTIDVAPDSVLDAEVPDATSQDGADDTQADTGPDSTDAGDTFNAQMCQGGFPGGGWCDGGLMCWSPPCAKCGAKPLGFCVPALQNGGCYDYTACNGGACVKAAPMNGVAGFCEPAVTTAGKCWPDASELLPDCYPGSTCEGAYVCGPLCMGPMADQPGTCKPAPEQKGQVYLWARNGSIVSPGETVTVTWVNNTGASIFLGGCGTYNIQSSADGQKWTDKGPGVMCVWEGIAVEVPAGGYFDTTSWQAPNTFSGGDMNFRFEGSYGTGCTPGKPMSQAGCTATATVDSTAFFVGAVP